VGDSSAFAAGADGGLWSWGEKTCRALRQKQEIGDPTALENGAEHSSPFWRHEWCCDVWSGGAQGDDGGNTSGVVTIGVAAVAAQGDDGGNASDVVTTVAASAAQGDLATRVVL